MGRIFFRFFYNVLLFVSLPLLLFWFTMRLIKRRASVKELLQKIGFIDDGIESSKKPMWFHAVSLGEARAAAPLIEYALISHGTHPVIISTTTKTGLDYLKINFGHRAKIIFFPFDFPLAVKKFLKKVNPLVAIFMETELWPNMLHACRKRRIPMLLANARLSLRSAKKYHRIKPLMQDMLSCIDIVAAQAMDDAKRFLDLGCAKDKILVVGNIKFDAGDVFHNKQALENRLCFLAASTHAGEEEKIIAAFKRIRSVYPDALLLVAPRHPERCNSVARLCEKNQLNYLRQTVTDLDNKLPVPVFLIDTIGELEKFYRVANIVFVGGSLVPVGGHNLIEPACFQLPIITGSHLDNIVAISDLFSKALALKIVNDEVDLADTVILLWRNKDERQEMGKRAQQLVLKNRGAVLKHLSCIDDLLNKGVMYQQTGSHRRCDSWW